MQCHKTSMELIADGRAQARPRATELFERYGCYACHKVDWFPTKRRPGPSLTNLQAKVEPPSSSSAWIADPKAFRPTTWMPQLFHLENYAPDEVVVNSEYGAGREILGQEWNDAAIDAIAAFLRARAPRAGARGRSRWTATPTAAARCSASSGCLALPQPRAVTTAEPLVEATSTSMRNAGRTSTARTCAAWPPRSTRSGSSPGSRTPPRYWPETRMPNLRLSDQDAADIVAYVTEDPDGIFHDVPEGW